MFFNVERFSILKKLLGLPEGLGLVMWLFYERYGFVRKSVMWLGLEIEWCKQTAVFKTIEQKVIQIITPCIRLKWILNGIKTVYVLLKYDFY